MASFFFRFFRVLLVLFIAVGVAFWLFQTRKRPEKQTVVHAPPGVRVIEALAEPQTMHVDAFGTVVPRIQVNIAAEVGGRIDHLHPMFREGAYVGKGEVLVRLDQRAFILEKEAARARVEQAKADAERLEKEIVNFQSDLVLAQKNLALAKTEWDRVKALGENQFASKTAVDQAEQQYLAARIQLQSAQNRLALAPPMRAQLAAALDLAQTSLAKADLVLEKSEIRSGFDGYVLAKQAELGEFVNPGQVLGVLYEKGGLDVDIQIPLEDLAWIEALLNQGRLPQAQVSMANMAGGRVWTARVARIKANIDEKTRTLPLTLEIVSDDDAVALPSSGLKPGSFVKCRIQGQTIDKVIRLPRHLLQGESTLFVVREGRLEIRKVTVLRKFEEEIFVSDGIVPGDRIVATPLPGAVEGMPLTVKAVEEAQ